MSHEAERSFRAWMDGIGADIAVAFVDVIAERPLARGLTAALGVDHASPQLLAFGPEGLAWNGSHRDLNEAAFERVLNDLSG